MNTKTLKGIGVAISLLVGIGAASRALALLIAIASFATPATAATVNPDPSVELHDQATAEAIDIAIIADDKGWSLAATRRHLDDQHAFGELQDQIEAQFPTKFAGAEFAASPGGRSYLRFKGAVPSAARSLATDAGLNVGLTGGRKYSAAELANRAVAVVRFFGDAGYQLVGSAVLPSGLIEVAVTGEQTPGAELPPLLSDGVRVTFVGHDVVEEFHTYGGAYVHGSSSECTSGFTVQSQLTNETGVTTAAHCSGIDHYHQPQGGPSYDMVFEDEHEGLNGDVQWHTTLPDQNGVQHADLAEYYASPTDLREVNSVETSAAVNNTYCVYSRRQGTRTCDQVYSTFVTSLTFSGGLVSNLVAMEDLNAVPGDSGGPWSYSTEAVGSDRGSQWIWFKTRDVWSKAWLFDSAIDVEVMTQ